MKPSTRSLVCLTLCLSAGGAFAAVPSLVEVRARNFEVITIDGERVALAELLRADRPTVVEFWATWCAPCRKTVPDLVELSTRYGTASLTVLGLTVEDPVADAGKVREFASQQGVSYPLAFASPEIFQFMNQRDEVGVPKLLVYDAAGNVVEHVTSYSPFTMRRVAKAVRRAIGEK